VVVISDGRLGNWYVHGNPLETLEIREYSEELVSHGSWDLGDDYGVRKMTLRLVSDYLTPEQKVSERLALNVLFSSEQELLYEGLTYKVILDGVIEYTNHPHALEATVPLILCDPFAYSEEYETTSKIVNEGTAPTYPLIEIYGSATNPSVTIGDEVLSWNGTLLSGETLYIDCDKRTVKKGSANALKDYNGVFVEILPGEVNVSSSSNFKVKWRNRYL